MWLQKEQMIPIEQGSCKRVRLLGEQGKEEGGGGRATGELIEHRGMWGRLGTGGSKVVDYSLLVVA